MANNNFIHDLESIYKDYENIEKQAVVINNLWIKYSITKDKRIIEEIIN